MVRTSSLVLLAGVGFLFTPIPPIATIIGVVLILAGLGMRFLGDS